MTRYKREGFYRQMDGSFKRCRREKFLNDPITEHYGVGAEMVGLIRCSCDNCSEVA